MAGARDLDGISRNGADIICIDVNGVGQLAGHVELAPEVDIDAAGRTDLQSKQNCPLNFQRNCCLATSLRAAAAG
jgi:hypothetical protein